MALRPLLVRLLWTAVSLLVLLTVLHAVAYALPGDPVRALFGLRAPRPELLAELRAAYGLDDPYPAQLGRYLRGLLTGDLGPLYGLSPNGLSVTGQSVAGAVMQVMPRTLTLVGVAALLQTVVGTTLSTWMSTVSRRQHHAVKAVACLLVAVPSFVLAGLLVVWAPTVVAAVELLAGAACLAALPAGTIALVGHPQVHETLRSPFVRRAVAAGIPAGRVAWLHALRPSVGPMVTLSAAELGSLLTASVLVEPVIGRDGVGALLVSSLQARQGPVTLAVVGIFLIAVAVVNLLADVLIGVLDPRIDAVGGR